MPKEVIIIGAGGHGRVVADIVRASGDLVIGFLDDADIKNVPLLGKIEDCEKHKDKYVIIAIGNNNIRRKVAEKYLNLNYYTAIHPSAIIGSDVKISEGSCVMPHAVINSGASVGKHCIINTHAIVEHDCFVNSFSHISPGVTLCGTVYVGQNTQIGAGSVVRNNINITDNVIIGAGSVVVKDITASGTYMGVPAKIKK